MKAEYKWIIHESRIGPSNELVILIPRMFPDDDDCYYFRAEMIRHKLPRWPLSSLTRKRFSSLRVRINGFSTGTTSLSDSGRKPSRERLPPDRE